MTQGGTAEVQKGGRDWGIDVARGFAVLLMIQTHAYDAWVRVADRGTWLYRITRELGAIPAPIFVMLAGIGVAFGERAMEKKGQPTSAIRMRFLKRGGEVVLYAYVVSVVYALMDGARGIAEMLRADILHAIGLSIVALALAVVGRSRKTSFALGGVAVTLALSVVGTHLVRNATSDSLAPVAALIFDVPPYSRFPLIPTVAFALLGYVIGHLLQRRSFTVGSLALAFGSAVAVAILANLATKAWVAAAGTGGLSRMHPALVANYVDGCARAIAVVALAMLSAERLPSWLRSACVRLGQGSLWAYAFHIPFCYGRIGRSLQRTMGMGTATIAVLLLMLLTFVAVLARDLIRGRVIRSRA